MRKWAFLHEIRKVGVVPHDDVDIPGDAYVVRYIVSEWLKEDPHQSESAEAIECRI